MKRKNHLSRTLAWLLVLAMTACMLVGCTSGPNIQGIPTTDAATVPGTEPTISEEALLPPGPPLGFRFSDKDEYYTFTDAVENMEEAALSEWLSKNYFASNEDARKVISMLSDMPIPEIAPAELRGISILLYSDPKMNYISVSYEFNEASLGISMDSSSAASVDYSDLPLIQSYAEGKLFYQKTVYQEESEPKHSYVGYIDGHRVRAWIRNLDKTAADELMKTIVWSKW